MSVLRLQEEQNGSGKIFIMLLLGVEIICPADIYRFVERDQIIYDRQEKTLMNGMISYGYMSCISYRM